MSEPKDLKDVASYLLEAAQSSVGRRWRPPKKINALRPYKNEILEAYEKGFTFRQIAEIYTSSGHKISMAQIGRAIRVFLDEDLRAQNTGPVPKQPGTKRLLPPQEQTQLSVRAPRKFAMVRQHADIILEALRRGQTIAQIRKALSEMPNGFYVSAADLGRAIRILRKELDSEISRAQTAKVEEASAGSYPAPTKRLISIREKHFAQELLRGRRAAALGSPSFKLPQPLPPSHPTRDPFSKIKSISRSPAKNREEALARQRKAKHKAVPEKPASAPRKSETTRRRRGGR